jgi:hypothetical protein
LKLCKLLRQGSRVQSYEIAINRFDKTEHSARRSRTPEPTGVRSTPVPTRRHFWDAVACTARSTGVSLRAVRFLLGLTSTWLRDARRVCSICDSPQVWSPSTAQELT